MCGGSAAGKCAVVAYRIANRLWKIGSKASARIITQASRRLTGAEIHPGADVAKSVCIVHAYGVVIGETAVIGDRVIIYEEVTLGGTQLKCGKRHPTIEDRVTIGPGAKILGNITIGADSIIEANAVLTKSVRNNSVIAGVPGIPRDRREQCRSRIASEY